MQGLTSANFAMSAMRKPHCSKYFDRQGLLWAGVTVQCSVEYREKPSNVTGCFASLFEPLLNSFMKNVRPIFFGTTVRTILSVIGFAVGLASGIIGIVEYFKVERHKFIAETLYLEAGEPTSGYAKSAESAARFLENTDFDGSPASPFVFHILIDDYRASEEVVGIEDTQWEEQVFLMASNELMDVFFSPGFSQWHDGECTHLVVRFNLPGHAEVYTKGAEPHDPTRSYKILTSGWADDGDFVDLDGTWGPRNIIFDYSQEIGGSFETVASKWSLRFYSYSVPASVGGGMGVWRYRMLPEQSVPETLRSTLNSAETTSKTLLEDRRGF